MTSNEKKQLMIYSLYNSGVIVLYLIMRLVFNTTNSISLYIILVYQCLSWGLLGLTFYQLSKKKEIETRMNKEKELERINKNIEEGKKYHL